MLESSRTQDQLMIAARQKVKERKYWLNQLSGEPGKASIYTDKKRTGDTVSIDAVTFQLKGEVFERLMRLSGGADKPLHVILLSALFLLLNRYTGTQDIIIGTTIYRQDPDSHLQFTNTILPLRNRLDGADTFKDLLLQTRQTVLEAVEHQSYPMEVLVKELNLTPAKTHFPLFDAALLLKNIQDENYLKGIKIGFLFSFLSTGSGIEGKLEYDVLLYEREAVQLITAHFSRLLQSALENPGSPLASLEMLSDQEKKQLLRDFNDTYTDYPGDKTIGQLFAEQVKKIPDNAALVFADKKLTYKALNEKANQLARVLRGKGVEADTIVGLMMERSIEMITAILGILKAGGAYLSIDPGMPEKRILSMMNDCGVSILLTQTHVIHKHSFTLLQGLQAIRSEPLFTASRPQILDIDHLPIPDRSLVNYETYIQYIGQAPVKNVMTLLGTRGCPYHCAYCHKIWPKKHVPRSAENIFEEVKLFYDMGVHRFAFSDDVFNLDIKNSTKFFEMVINKELKVQFFFPSGIRGDILSEEYIDLMVEAGLTDVPLALETASPRLQKLMGKHLNIERFRKSVEYFCEKHPGVILELYVMIGFPTETKKEALMTLDFIKSVKWFHFPYIFLLKIWENTDMAKLAIENGVSREDILNSDILAYQELPDTLPFEKSFVIKLQADFLDEYFLSRERLRHVLPFQMKVMTEDEIVKKYDSYLPVDIRCFEDLLQFTGIKGEELPADGFVEEESVSITGLNEKLHRHFPQHSADKNALRVLLLDLTRFFSCEKDVIYNVLEAPLGLMYLLTTLNREYGSRVKGKIAKSSVDFDNYKELKILIADFKPDVIGIRAMNHYKNFFHQTTALIRQWGFSGILITGGPYATSNTTTLLQDKNIDLVVIGEGEVTFIDLVGKILENQGKLPDERTLQQVAGIAFVPGRRESRVKFAREILFFDELEDRLAAESPHNLEPINQSVNLAYTIFTSGSTGKPKGTLTTHGNVIRVVKDTNYIDIAADDRVLQLSNYAFDGSVFDIYGALLNGSLLVILKEDEVFSLDRLANVIKREGITVFFVTTALFNLLVEMELECFKGVRKVLFGGERISVDHARQALAYMGRDRIIHVYGPTETTVYAAFYFINEIPGTAGTIPIGAPIANTTLYILDRYLQPLPVGIPGEIYIGGSGTARGYMNCQELTGETFLPVSYKTNKSYRTYSSSKIYKTGDLARWLPDGNIVFLGRIDYQVKIRGFRVEPGEIENHLLNHKDIKKAAVVVREKENQEKYLCAYVVARREISSSQLREFLSRDLSEYMIPAHFIQLEAIPLTVNGKIDRKALPVPEMERVGTYTPPGNEVERKVVEIWSEILGIEANAISIKANFFELGGHSLKAAALSAHLHKILGVNVPLGKIFQNPTVQELAAFINKAEKEKYTAIEPVEKKEYYPMSSAQKRLYVLQELEPGNTTYNIPYVLSGENIHIPRLEHAFKQLISRHESLKTSFRMLGEEPVQKIHDQVEFEIEYFDLTTEAEGTGGKIHHSSLIIQNFLRAFDLSKSPLIRVGLIKLEQKKCTLMLEMHHIISDGTSMTIFVNEFRAFYQGKELPSLNIHYKDYSQWQHNVKNRESLEKQEAFWLKQFEDNISVLNLPLDYPRPAAQSFEGDRVEFSLTPEETKHLKEVALAEDLTLYMMILAIFDILLSRLSGQEDIIVGTPVAGRNHPDLKPIIGMFVNTLALRNYPLGEKTFKQFLKEIRKQTLEAFENQEYPFEELVEKVPVARDTSRNPFFDVMFVLQNFEVQLEEMPGKHVPGMKLRPYEYESKTAKFDLLLSAVETRETLFLSLEYCTMLFRDNTIQRFTRYFKHIVTAVLENPGISISAIDIVPGEEKQTLLFEFNNTRQDYPEDKTIYELFEDQVERTPDSVALVGSKSIQLTYMELNRKSVQLACLLQSKGVGPNTIVAIMTERSIEMVIGFFAVLKAGGAYLPIEPEYPQERVDYMLKDSNAALLLTEHELSDSFKGTAYRAPGILPATSNLHLSLAYILYTSGSTGMPRGVMIEHRSVVNILVELFNRYPLLETDTYLFKTPVVFDVSVSELFGWYPGGGRLAILENGAEKDPQKILDTIEAYRVTHINFVPSMFAAFLETLDRENIRKLTSLKYIFLAGEALPPEMVIRFRALNIHSGIWLENIYGPTEAAIYASYYSLHQWKGIGSIPIGKPLANVRLYILNAYYLLQPIGAAGELCIGGRGVAVGYLNQPELTAEKFLSVSNMSYRTYFSEKLYRTGDLARWQLDGIIEFLGRKDHQVKVRGAFASSWGKSKASC
ncbi:MAG: amino acid adenylation domain-containing protein [Candidatus Aminicenantes bacterium]|nr:amino acid adenylation domain-containing protein [Candidatus Aminicenantes bacterium]NIM79493.1 amino acid adenylation domain-containing protein [Candidatus Aminicenantes bacterium]NIN18779.1 amino acid adenylation domain-containing protein [Candidatus Aminicenantes bacterium]NIN42701.1 amino acid adenylation domain-containing protein [Candidatus Aminicenantes bacterium]NIN85435.1 amino acid adenylation domain-containing protein [Candidatus Aminicenantes bacterium]